MMVLVNSLSSNSSSFCWRVEVIHTATHVVGIKIVWRSRHRPREREEKFLGQMVGRGGWKGGEERWEV